MTVCNKKSLTEDQIAYVVAQSLKGLFYLHTQNIIHRYKKIRKFRRKFWEFYRDVKAANILLNDKCVVKIADFGVSEQLSNSVEKSGRTGTYRHMAPEVKI